MSLKEKRTCYINVHVSSVIHKLRIYNKINYPYNYEIKQNIIRAEITPRLVLLQLKFL